MHRLSFSRLVFFSSLLLLGLPMLQAQLCEVNITASPEHFCRGEMVTLSAENSSMNLSNPEDSLNFHRGVMFDLQALQTIVIEDFFVRPKQLTDIEVYYKIGSYDGWENIPTVWTLLGSVYNIPGASDPVPLGLNLELEIPAGQLYGFYITSTDPTISMYYNNGAGEGVFVTGDAQISLISGGGLEYPFGGTSGGIFQPRDFYGSIVYKANADFSWSDGTTGSSITVPAGAEMAYSVNANFPDLGCSAVDSILLIGSPEQFLPALTHLCYGDALLLEAGTSTDYTYLWSTGETTPAINLAGDFLPVGSTASFSVTIDDGAGCIATDNVDVQSIDPPVVVFPANLNYCLGSSTTLDAGGGAGFEYTWKTGATSQLLDLSAAGLVEGTNTLSVIVQSPEGCSTSGSLLVNARVCTGLEETANPIDFYPNPATDWLSINGIAEGSLWQIVDLSGKLVEEGKLQANRIRIEGLPSGTYFLFVVEDLAGGHTAGQIQSGTQVRRALFLKSN